MLGLLVGYGDLEAVFRAWLDNAIRYLPQVLMGLGVLLLSVIVAGWAKKVSRRTFKQTTGDRRAGNAMGTVVRYAVLFLGLVAALAVAGVDLGAMMVAVGAVGFALGFAMQDTIANLVAGFIVLSTQPFASEDAVRINDAEGKVEEISIRSTALRTFDGLKVEVPNKEVISNNITVFTEHPTRRFTIAVGIGYDDDIAGAVETAREAAASVDAVLDDPPVDVFVNELGGSSVNLNVRFWVERSSRGEMLEHQSRVTKAVKEALVDDGYDIPYPIRTVYLHEENGAEPVEA
jgi:small-conductance mechanosensitive channel